MHHKEADDTEWVNRLRSALNNVRVNSAFTRATHGDSGRHRGVGVNFRVIPWGGFIDI